METWSGVLQNERNLESPPKASMWQHYILDYFPKAVFSLIHPFIHQLLGTYYILSLVPRFEDKNIMKTGSLQSQTHSLACDEHKPVNN